MNIKELKEMINLMQENGITELEIEKEGFKIRLKKGVSGTIIREEAVSIPEAAAMTKERTREVAQEKAPEAPGDLIKSPMVGTFYAAPAPDAESYATTGKEINPGDVLCIIEAMKLMNEIKSEIKGKIVEVLVQNGQPVEFDQPLFRIQRL